MARSRPRLIAARVPPIVTRIVVPVAAFPRRVPMPSTAQPTCFLIADISGYTGYLADVELDHAQDILADLIGAVVTALRPELPAGQARGRCRVHLS